MAAWIDGGLAGAEAAHSVSQDGLGCDGQIALFGDVAIAVVFWPLLHGAHLRTVGLLSSAGLVADRCPLKNDGSCWSKPASTRLALARSRAASKST